MILRHGVQLLADEACGKNKVSVTPINGNVEKCDEFADELVKEAILDIIKKFLEKEESK